MQLFVFFFSFSVVVLCVTGLRGVFLVFGICLGYSLWKKTIHITSGIIFAIIVRGIFLSQQSFSDTTQAIVSRSGIVVTTAKRNAFVLQDGSGKKYYVTHKDQVNLGDRVTVKGYNTSAKHFSWFPSSGTLYERLVSSPLGGYFDYPAWLAMKGYDGSIGSFEIKKTGSCVECLPWWNRSVLRLIEEVQRWRGDTEQAGLLLGLLVGYRGMLSKQTNEQFAESGLIHLIAVSGGNLVMIASLLGLLLFWLPVYVRFVVIAIGLCLYGLLCGFDSSVIRALIMALLGIVAIFLGKPSLSRRLISVTYLLMLVWNPLYLLYDLGFQLSFMSVVGIMLFQEWYGTIWDETLQYKKKLQKSFLKGVWSHLLVSFAAFIFTLPILFLTMGKVNITGLFSNIFIVPFIPILQIGGFISTWTSEWIETQGIIRWMLDALIGVARRTQDYGVQLVIEELWVKWVMVVLWGVVILFGMNRNKKE